MREDLIQGDLIRVEWVDIFEDSTGDPDEADLAHRVSYGIFWCVTESYGVKCLVTTTTMEKSETPGGTTNSGFCIYPEGCIIKISTIRRRRRKKVIGA